VHVARVSFSSRSATDGEHIDANDTGHVVLRSSTLACFTLPQCF
jgi:hypothetical protein